MKIAYKTVYKKCFTVFKNQTHFLRQPLFDINLNAPPIQLSSNQSRL